jgi:hypothetical protein
MPSLNYAAETTMTMGNVLYLAMAIGMFVLISAALAYASWQQSRIGPDVVPIRAQAQPEEHPDALTA